MTVEKSKNPRSVFVVHGRNDVVRDSMFGFLRSINLKPIEWTQAVALTGHGSPYIGQILDAAFNDAQAIVTRPPRPAQRSPTPPATNPPQVLLTPDEVAYLQPRYGTGDDDPEIQPAAQARPNVLFEAGMALGRDAERTVVVEVGEARPFSDFAGRHVVRLDNTTENRQALAHRLQTAGCAVDLSGTNWHTAGDFSSPTPAGGGLPLGRRVPSDTRTRPLADFDVKYIDKGNDLIHKLQVINRGTSTAYGVSLSLPEGSALSLRDSTEIEKIPGGKSVTVDVFNDTKTMAVGPKKRAFDITVEGRTETGEVVSQQVFIDVNG